MGREAKGDKAKPFRIAAAIIADDEGRLLLVRKVGTDVFMQAGGKLHPGETPLAALRRELREEIGVEIDLERPPAYRGIFHADAANEPGRRVEAHLFDLKLTVDVQPAAEICEVIWVDPGAPITVAVAPLTRLYALGAAQRVGRTPASEPLLRRRKRTLPTTTTGS